MFNYHFVCFVLLLCFVCLFCFFVKSNLFGFMFLLVIETVLGRIVIGLTPGSVFMAEFGF